MLKTKHTPFLCVEITEDHFSEWITFWNNLSLFQSFSSLNFFHPILSYFQTKTNKCAAPIYGIKHIAIIFFKYMTQCKFLISLSWVYLQQNTLELFIVPTFLSMVFFRSFKKERMTVCQSCCHVLCAQVCVECAMPNVQTVHTFRESHMVSPPSSTCRLLRWLYHCLH